MLDLSKYSRIAPALSELHWQYKRSSISRVLAIYGLASQYTMDFTSVMQV